MASNELDHNLVVASDAPARRGCAAPPKW